MNNVKMTKRMAREARRQENIKKAEQMYGWIKLNVKMGRRHINLEKWQLLMRSSKYKMRQKDAFKMCKGLDKAAMSVIRSCRRMHR